jgi:hypothetical protein
VESLALNETGHRQPHRDDLWSPLNYAIGAGVGTTARGAGIARWVRDDDSRRLVAYQFLAALAKNTRRYWLPASMWQTPPPAGSGDERTLAEASPTSVPAANYREYGNGASLVDVARSLILGDEQRFRVPDAEPGPRPDGGGQAPPGSPLAKAVQEWLDDWAEKELLTEKIREVENHSIGLGDGVVALVWSTRKKRPRPQVHHPGMYFPDRDAATTRFYRDAGWEDEDYPPVVHLAWEFEDPDEAGRRWVDRSTWRLLPTKTPRTVRYSQDPVEWSCWFEKTWFEPDSDGSVYEWTTATKGARVITEPVDLGVDFIPVVHVPNTPPGSAGWGESLLMYIAQVLDDVASTDTDLAVNAETVAGGTVISKGATEAPPGGPGWWSFMADGDAKMLDNSRVLDALLKDIDRLEKKLALNSRLGEILLGLVAANEVPSGYAMRLGFSGPAALERELTGVRARRYALLGKMAVRMAQQASVLNAGPTPPILFVLGKGLPVDRAAAIAEVRDLLTPPAATSTVTAVRMLMDAGLPIEDAEEEVARIRSEQLDDAVKLMQATGDVKETRLRLGLNPDTGPDELALQQAAAGQAPDPAAPDAAPAAGQPTDQPAAKTAAAKPAVKAAAEKAPAKTVPPKKT